MSRLSALLPALLCAGLIAAFFMLLPDIRYVEKPLRDQNRKKDRIACAVITAAYAIVSYVNLGTVDTPQSFAEFQTGESAVLALEEPAAIEGILLYTGINVGEYRLEISEDGESWSELCCFDQNYAQILKWQEPELSDNKSVSASYLKVTAVSGDPWLGEVVLFSSQNILQMEPLSGTQASALADEQELVPEEISYLNSSYFDEIYHVRTAEEHIQGMWPYEISHPPLGKLIISLGVRLFGLVPFGWRFFGTLFGVLMLPAIYAFLSALFADTFVSSCGTVLLATDFMHFTQTRIATIDSFAVFFIILMYYFMHDYVNRESRRSLFLSGLFFGFGAACKWTCLYAGAGLAVIWAVHRIGELVQAENKKDEFHRCLVNIGQCLVFFVLIPTCIYYLSYIPYGRASGLKLPGMLFSREYAGLVLDNQKFMFSYHSGVSATHPYSSKWYQWVLDIRPILYYLKLYPDGSRSSFGAFVNPLLCWGGAAAILMLLFLALRRKDRTAAFILIGYFAQLVPWMFVDRILFEYHYFACSVFLVLAMGYMFSLMSVEKYGKKLIAGYTAASGALFALFYPVLSGMRIGETWQSFLGWLPTWPF